MSRKKSSDLVEILPQVAALNDLGKWSKLTIQPAINLLNFARERGMSMQMTRREVDDVFVMTLEGRIVLGEESHSLREKLKSVIAEGNKKIVLNMAQIKYIDSSGLGALVAAHYSAKTHCSPSLRYTSKTGVDFAALA
jgi:anti-anti-sigma factor